MASHTVPIAPIPLARSSGRLLGGPLILLVAGGVAVVGGVDMGGAAGIGLVAAGLVVVALSLYLAVMLLSVRLDVEVATLRLRWMGGERRYTLVRGAVTRVPLIGNEAAGLRPRFGALGWGLGKARLRGDETVELVRLAPSSSMILVPTDHGRVGVAPASEQQLLNALAAAARIQQRLDEVAERTRSFVPRPSPAEAAASAEQVTAAAELAKSQAAAGGRRMLTGIERTLLEEHLAAERAAALFAAETERQVAVDAERMAAFVAGSPEAAAPGAARRWPRAHWQRPAWLSTPARPRMALPRPTLPTVAIPSEQLVGYGLALAPVLAAGVLWLVAALTGRLELPIDELRQVAVALLAVGPAGAVAALVARTWFPRLLGLVTVTSLAGLTLVGRALLG